MCPKNCIWKYEIEYRDSYEAKPEKLHLVASVSSISLCFPLPNIWCIGRELPIDIWPKTWLKSSRRLITRHQCPTLPLKHLTKQLQSECNITPRTSSSNNSLVLLQITSRRGAEAMIVSRMAALASSETAQHSMVRTHEFFLSLFHTYLITLWMCLFRFR